MSFTTGRFVAGFCALLSICLAGCSGGTTPSASSPALAIVSVAPSTVLAGSAATTLTVTGTGLTPSTVIEIGSVSEATTYVSSTQVTAILPANQLATAGSATITAVNGSSASSGILSLQINNPVPAITQISPSTLPSGTASASVTVTGTGFVGATTVQVDGSARPTTFVNGTQLTVVLSASDLAAMGTHSITAVNPAPGGGAASPISVSIGNPIPMISTLAPSSIIVGGVAGTTVTVTGTNFVSGSVAQVNGSARSTTFVSATQLSFQLTVSDQSATGALSVTVLNPSPGGGTSAAASLAVNNPVPTISQLSPATLAAGSPATTITVTGTNFVSGTVIQVGGNARAATIASGSQLTFQLTASDLASAGSINVVALNPAPGGGSSAAATVAVSNPVPSLLSLSPSLVITGTTTPTTITVTGTGFLPVSTVQVGGSSRATTYVSGTQLTFQTTAADQATTANLSITVANPIPGGGTSSLAYLAVAAATQTPVLNSVTPSQVIVNSPATTISVTGSNLTSRSTVLWNGTSLVTSYGTCLVNYTYTLCLRATVPANLLTTVGTASITVSSPTATPSVSNALQVSVTYPLAPTLFSISAIAGAINTAVSLGITGTNFVSSSVVLLNGTAVPTTFSSSTSLIANIPAASLATPGVFPISVFTPAPGGGTSTALYFTAYVAIPNNSMAYNPANGLFYLSVPSAVGAPYGNTIVPVDPLTGRTGAPIPVGSEPNRLAITSDGKYLWVALDGAGAVRKVDLTTGTAGLQFPIGPSGSSIYTVAALAALPGSPDSVVVSTYYGGYTTPTGQSLTIYDSGVARTNSIAFSTYAPFPWALLVNGTTNEIYGPGSVLGAGPYITYNYDATGIKQKSSTNSSLTYAVNTTDDVQIVGSTLYDDYGQGVNAETGALLGTFYSSGTTAAQGSITVDPALGKAFILEGSAGAFNGSGTGLASATLGAFNVADYGATSATPISLSIPLFRASYQYAGPTSSRLTRWGSNGLAFRGTGGFVSLRSSLVQDLSSVNADLAVSVAAASSAATGTNTTFTVTVANYGPSAASGVSLIASVPSTGVLVSATPSVGSCVPGTPVVCDLGGLANGANNTIVFTVLPVSAGAATLSTQVSASETDPTSSNNSASATVTVSGNAYNPAPALASLSPAGIVSGSSDMQITLTGTNFVSGAVVQMNGAGIQTSFVSSTKLTATVPAASLATLGWASIAVANPTPGGGTSGVVPLYVFSVLPVNASHIVYEPYSRKLMAGIATGTSTLAANSLVAIIPETSAVGTPVALSGTPASLAVTSDGQFLYALVPGTTSGSIARFNMLSQQLDFTASGFQATGYEAGLRDLATLPGSPNTIAVDEGEYTGTSLFDFNGSTKTATRRGSSTGLYSGTCLTFPNSSQIFITDLEVSGVFQKIYSVTASGLPSTYSGANLQSMNCTKVDGNMLFGQAGGVASLSGALPTQTGTFQGMPFVSNYGAGIKDFAPDASLAQSFYLTSASPNEYSAIFDSITAFNIATYMPSNVLTLPFSTFEGNNSFTGVDMVRWGQDGLAIPSSGGTIYLVRGPVVVPGFLGTSSVATLSSSTTLARGSGNTLLTLTGANFLPGVAVTWNGSYRNTTVLSPTQLTVAIPSSDLVAVGTASLVATNPGATSSAPITISVQ